MMAGGTIFVITPPTFVLRFLKLVHLATGEPYNILILNKSSAEPISDYFQMLKRIFNYPVTFLSNEFSMPWRKQSNQLLLETRMAIISAFNLIGFAELVKAYADPLQQSLNV